MTGETFTCVVCGGEYDLDQRREFDDQDLRTAWSKRRKPVPSAENESGATTTPVTPIRPSAKATMSGSIPTAPAVER